MSHCGWRLRQARFEHEVKYIRELPSTTWSWSWLDPRFAVVARPPPPRIGISESDARQGFKNEYNLYWVATANWRVTDGPGLGTPGHSSNATLQGWLNCGHAPGRGRNGSQNDQAASCRRGVRNLSSVSMKDSKGSQTWRLKETHLKRVERLTTHQ